jgi:inosine-uridine nucleoside N-ribohydrolase
VILVRKIIVDTDIGGDIDDIWALILMLSTNLFDVKLISVTNGDIDYQVKIVAKILYLLNKQYIPIAKGVSNNNENIYPQLKWVEDFDLKNYSGRIYESYQEAYKEVLNKDSEVALIGLAPLSSLVTVVPILQKYNIKTILMAGSINIGYFDSDTPDAECNIVSDLEAARLFLSSNIDVTLAPLDVCNKIIINKDNYKNIRSSITQHS